MDRETKKVAALLLFGGVLLAVAISLYDDAVAGDWTARLGLAGIAVLLIVLELTLRRDR